jgi:hypothetical protein
LKIFQIGEKLDIILENRRLLFKGKLQSVFKQQSPDKSTVEKQHKYFRKLYIRHAQIELPQVSFS